MVLASTFYSGSLYLHRPQRGKSSLPRHRIGLQRTEAWSVHSGRGCYWAILGSKACL